jgi:glutamine synthetase
MAFTGNKFEFRAVGSSQSCAGSNVVLNTIVAWAMDEICTEIETKRAEKKDLNEVLQTVLQGVIRKHKRILFDGDNYTAEWKAEAAKRGLPNLTKTPESLEAMIDKKTIALFEKYGVFNEREVRSRYEVYLHTYDQTVALEGGCALRMARTMVAPAAVRFLGDLSAAQTSAPKSSSINKTIKEVAALSDDLYKVSEKLETAVKAHKSAATLAAMSEMRTTVDALENLIPSDLWPMPTYGEMLFL